MGSRTVAIVGTTTAEPLDGGEPFAIACAWGAVGEVRWVQERWRSWAQACDEWADDDKHVCDPHCRQVYVAYEATPRVGYRPRPDQARITYLDESTPLDRNPKLLGPWDLAGYMPAKFSRMAVQIVDVKCDRSPDGRVWEWVLKVRSEP